MSDAIIVGYHHVSSSPQHDPLCRGLEVAASRFRQQLEILVRRFALVSLEDLLESLARGSGGRPSAAITFDDGYEDNYTCAFPILARMGIPATVFLCTDNIEHARPFWTDRLAAYVCRSAGAVVAAPDELSRPLDPTAVSDVRQRYERLRAELSGLEYDRREQVLDRLGAEAATPRPLTWCQVRHMHRDGITFGAHTRSHPSLPRLSDASARAEVETSRDLIRARLGAAPTVFAYPFGDADDRVRQIVEVTGFRGAVTARSGRCGPNVDPLLLPRLMVHDWPRWGFERRLMTTRFAALLERARAHARPGVGRGTQAGR